MTRLKKIVAAIILVLFVAAVLFLFFVKKEPESPFVAPKPNLPARTKGFYLVEFLVDEKDFSFPQKATVDTKKILPLDKNAVSQTAAKLSLTEGPIIAQDVADGEVNIYRSGSAALTAYVDKGGLRFTLNTLPPAPNNILGDETLKVAASDFLLVNGFALDEEIAFSSFLYLSTEGGEGLREVSRENARLVQVNFVPTGAEVPLLSINPSSPPIYVRLLPDGKVFSASIENLTIQKGIGEYSLKTYSEVKTSAQTAVLVSLDDGNVHLPDLPPGAIKKVSFHEISLARLIETKSELLIPVFLLVGEAEVEGYGRINAKAYLPALKGP